jgi:mRNA-degrading endonuclease toxin of MazEF toxin-antitoxin module
VVPEQINSVLGDDLMIIESGIGLLVIGTVVYLFWRSIKDDASKTDLNKDGKVNVEDAKAALDKVVEKVVFVADVNKDGKVNVDDIKTVAKKVEDKVTTLVDEVKTKKSAKKVQPVAAPVAAPEEKPKRARNKGKLIADNPATPDVNEAWEGGKAPEKATKPKKPKKPKMTVAK